MKRIKLLGVAILAIFVISAVAAATASAEFPEILPVPTAGSALTFTFTSGAGKLELTNKKVVECEKDKGTGSFTTQDSGTVGVNFEGCKEKTSGAKCTSTGAEAGHIILLATGTDITLVDYKESTTLTLGGVISLLEMVKFKCGVISFEVLGAVMGKIDGVTSLVKTKTATLLFHQTAGMQALTTCELLKAFCEGKTFMLETTEGKGHELAGLESEEAITFGIETEVHF